jgi:NhaP-type Na+/H+ or K+/H+ antiporter
MIGLTIIVLLGVGATWLAWRLKLPSILLLLLAGFLVGPATGFLDTDALLGDILFPFVSFAVALILYEGGRSRTLSHSPKGVPLN